MSAKIRSTLIGGTLIGAVLVMAYITWKKRINSKPKFPLTARWRLIGTLKNILIFPMKSCGYTELEEAFCTELGPVAATLPGLFTLRDRCFVVYRLDTMEMISCMTFPIMTSIKISAVGENTLLLKSSDKANLELVVPTSGEKRILKAKMWTGETIEALDCGDQAGDWITELIKGDKNVGVKLRIGYWPQGSNKHGDENFDPRGAFQNYTSYMMMTTASLEDLRSRIPSQSFDFKQFRPNFMIETTLEPYAEDKWSWIKIGEDEGATFTKIKNCGRCPQININAETFKFDTKHEPLTTLSKYRKPDSNSNPIMGICLGLYKAGRVNVGDNVYIIF